MTTPILPPRPSTPTPPHPTPLFHLSSIHTCERPDLISTRPWQAFDIEIPDEEAESMTTPADCVTAIKAKLG